MCVRVCVCVREREVGGDRNEGGEKEGGKKRDGKTASS